MDKTSKINKYLSSRQYRLKEDLNVRLGLNYSQKVILCTGDTNAIYKASEIPLEYDSIFDEPYAATIGEMYTGTTSILYTKITLSRKDTAWKIDVNNLAFIAGLTNTIS